MSASEAEEPVTDERIGANIALLRGRKAQKELAEDMTLHGFKWSQTTVWEVEKGKRALKLAEAKALASLLGVHLDDFFGDKAAARQEQELQRFLRIIHAQRREIGKAIWRTLAAQDALRDIAASMGITIPDSLQSAMALDKDGIEAKLAFALAQRVEETVRSAIHGYKTFREDPHSRGSMSVRRIVEEVAHGEHPEAR